MATKSFWENRIVDRGEVPPEQLLPHPRAWRQHPRNQQEAMKGMLDEVGWIQTVIVNQRTGYMLDGALRANLAKRHGEDLIPVVYVDLSEEEELLVLAAFDPITGMATANEQALAALVDDATTDNASLRELLDSLLGEHRLLDGLCDPDEAPSLPEAPVSRPGDLWRCGEHRVLCGDATDGSAVTRLLDGEPAA